MRRLALLLALPALAADIPRVWTDEAVSGLELPLASPAPSVAHIPEADYYRIPERVIYRSYPVYAPGRAPAGYSEWLKTREPDTTFTPTEFGEAVFNAPTSVHPMFFTAADLTDPARFARLHMPVAKDGSVPFARWVVRARGVVELGAMGCNTCHTRVLPDGTVVPGAQGNNPNDRQGAELLRATANAMGPAKTLAQVRSFAARFESPWLPRDLNGAAAEFDLEAFINAGLAIPPGVTARANTSMLLPPQIPDLIGVRDRRFLDHTGIVRHRDIGDLMRYSSLAQDMFAADVYAGYPVRNAMPSVRYSDAQLYALAQYLYSLRPPPNPNPSNAAAHRGRAVFTRAKCIDCHTPPLYTNNKLVTAAEVGLDPRYTQATHKATGFYKVPSLTGLWYRGPLGHNGQAATIEDWLDPARLHPDYIPTAFAGYDGRTRSIPGHPFGLDLRAADRRDLIAFLRTL